MQASIKNLIDTATVAKMVNNRQKLRSILQTVVMCEKQNIVLSGHRDKSQHWLSGVNQEYFHMLLQYRVEIGNHMLKIC